MTERKPAGVNYETWADRQVREATERGEFDNLPGAGKPIPNLDQPYDAVWATRLLSEAGASPTDALPPSLRLRREIGELRETVRTLHSEDAVRDTVEALNERVLQHLRMPSGPQVPVRPVDVERVVAEWRADRATREPTTVVSTEPEPGGAHPTADPESTAKPSWWRRLLGRH